MTMPFSISGRANLGQEAPERHGILCMLFEGLL